MKTPNIDALIASAKTTPRPFMVPEVQWDMIQKAADEFTALKADTEARLAALEAAK
jgi:hypothetical protein